MRYALPYNISFLMSWTDMKWFFHSTIYTEHLYARRWHKALVRNMRNKTVAVLVSEGELPAQMELSAIALSQERAQQVEEQCGIQCEGREWTGQEQVERMSERSRGLITEVTGCHGKHSGCPFKPREESLEGLRDTAHPDLTFRVHSSCCGGNRP